MAGEFEFNAYRIGERLGAIEASMEHLVEGLKVVSAIRDDIIRMKATVEIIREKMTELERRVAAIEAEGRDYRATVIEVRALRNAVHGEGDKPGLIERLQKHDNIEDGRKARTALIATISGIASSAATVFGFLHWPWGGK